MIWIPRGPYRGTVAELNRQVGFLRLGFRHRWITVWWKPRLGGRVSRPKDFVL